MATRDMPSISSSNPGTVAVDLCFFIQLAREVELPLVVA